jgi:adenylylsulfate kinase
MGLPGAGKTTLARLLARKLGAVAFYEDEIRAEIAKDLGVSPEDRIEQARRLGWLCDRVVDAGRPAIAEFICPTPAARAAFGDAFTIWVDRIVENRRPETDLLFTSPDSCDVRVLPGLTPEQTVDLVYAAFLRKEQTSKAPAAPEAVSWFTTAKQRLELPSVALPGLARLGWPLRPVELRALPYSLLCVAIVMTRHLIDNSPFDAINSLLQFVLLGAAMYWGGISGSIVSFIFILVYDFFLVDPIFTIGTHDWPGLAQLALGTILAIAFGIAASRSLNCVDDQTGKGARG